MFGGRASAPKRSTSIVTLPLSSWISSWSSTASEKSAVPSMSAALEAVWKLGGVSRSATQQEEQEETKG